MFNEEQKQKFIHYQTESESARNGIAKVFGTLERFEVELGKDLAEFTDEEMCETFSRGVGLRNSTRTSYGYIVNRYLEWAKKQGVDVVCNEIKIDSDTLVERYRQKMVFSPEHLNRYMDAVFGGTDDCSAGLICRCYLWLAFCGVDIMDAERLDARNVDIDQMRAVVNGREVPLYAESIKAFRVLKNSDEIRVINSLYPDKLIMMQREDGTRLLRGQKRVGVSKAVIKEGEHGNLSGEVQRRTRKAVDAGVVTARLNFKNVKLSGVFYRMYAREEMGIKPDFTVIAAFDLRDKKFASNLSYNSSISRIRTAYKKDYALWKSAYELYKEDSHL